MANAQKLPVKKPVAAKKVASKKLATKKPAAKKPAAKKTMKIKPARLINVWDRSGSMENVISDATGAFNGFIAQQRSLKAKTRVLTVIFDDKYEVIHNNLDIVDVPVLTNQVYFARNTTAYLDALGRTVTEAMATEVKGEKTILTIMTDGYENASREFTIEQVKKLITKVQDELGWEVNFLGANIDAAQVGSSLGTRSSNNANIKFSAKGYGDAGLAMSLSTSMSRGANFADLMGTSGFSGIAGKISEDYYSAQASGKGTTLEQLYTEVEKATEKTGK